jgi:phosphoserine phosphatase RsbU/P
MAENSEIGAVARAAYLTGGAAAVALVVVLTWFDLTASLNLRRPVPSLDGQYFAYFDRVESRMAGGASAFDLIISTSEGRALGRYRLAPGELSWSAAGHLLVVRKEQGLATVIPNAGGRFVVLTSLAILPGTMPRWAESGTKFAFVRPGSANPELAVYDLLQTQASTVPLPLNVPLVHPILLFWSPGGQELYFLNHEGREVVLYRTEILTGNVSVMARSPLDWGGPILSVPKMSPDGNEIYLPIPSHSVIDAGTGATLWTLPAHAKVLESPWSADGSRLFYSLLDAPGSLYAHDFSSHSDRAVLSGAPNDGFFSADGGSYLFKERQTVRRGIYGSRLRQWLAEDWGWRHVDLVTHVARSLGREELWPWAMTSSGQVLMSRDDYTHVYYGLYDPSAGAPSTFRFPTDREDVFRQLTARTIMLPAIALYGLLGFFVFFLKPHSPPARSLYVLCLVLMVLFTSLDFSRSLLSIYADWGFQSIGPKIKALGWTPLLPRVVLMEDQFFVFLLFLALLPPALLRFAVVFPEGNRFLSPRKALQVPLYGVAFLPAVGILVALTSFRLPAGVAPLMSGLTLIGGGTAMVTAFLALVYNFRNPPNRRARDQARWVTLALSVPVAGSLILLAVDGLVPRLLGEGSQRFLGIFSATTLSLLCLFTPLAIDYALLAHKLFDIHLFIRRTLRYSFLTTVVLVVYLLLVGGLSWAIAGSVAHSSTLVLILSTILTAIILAPARRHLDRVIDRTLAREQYDFRETLQGFAGGLPNVLDRQTLASVTGRTLRAALKAQSFYLFALDRRAKKLRPVTTERRLPAGIAEMEFDPGEPLCRYLLEQTRPFEVEVSPYNPELIPIFQSAADRFSKLRAAVIFGLARRKELAGMMVLGGKVSDEFYNAEDLRLLQMVAGQAAIALDNTELFEEVSEDSGEEKELETVDEVRAQLMPRVVPPTSGCEISVRSAPARTGGADYYDFVELPGQKIGLAIGAVSGKGVAAAQLMIGLQGLVRAHAASGGSLASVVRRINRQLFSSSPGAKYCTLFYAVYDQTTRLLQFVNAGHNPPLMLGSKGTRLFGSTGVPLGLFSEVTHDVRSVTLEHGTTVILYSDGVTEARNPEGEIFGVDRLTTSAQHAGNANAPAMAESILSDAREFAGGKPSEEDQTLVLLKVSAT